MNKTYLYIGGIVLVAAVAGWLVVRGRSGARALPAEDVLRIRAVQDVLGPDAVSEDGAAAGGKGATVPSPKKRVTFSDVLDRRNNNNNNVDHETAPFPSTADEVKADEMRNLLDEGDEHGALRMARDLMDSDEPLVRSLAVTTFGWAGAKAIDELIEMISDADSQVADDAATQLEQALGEMEDDAAKIQAIEDAVADLTEPDRLNQILILLSQLPLESVFAPLERMINGQNRVTAEAALEWWEHFTGGHSYPEREPDDFPAPPPSETT